MYNFSVLLVGSLLAVGLYSIFLFALFSFHKCMWTNVGANAELAFFLFIISFILALNVRFRP